MQHTEHDPQGATVAQRIGAWAVHAFTASGALWALLALFAATRGDWRPTFGWMALALFVDAFDGILARRARVKAILPGFDGELLDNTLDYLNYVLVPAFVAHQAGLLPAALSLAGVAVICLSSAYQFCQADAKTADHFFKGFPSYWNVLVFYLFFGNLAPPVNLAIVALFAVLVFVPLRWIYPSRMPRWRATTIALTCVWGASCLGLVAQLPSPDPRLLLGSLAYVAYYVAASLYLEALRLSG